MSKQSVISSQHKTGNRASVTTYSIGFALSIVLTLAAYLLVRHSASMLSYGVLVFAILTLAVVQLLIQLQFFIHLGHESKPRWNKLIFLFMLLVVLIVVVGSLWIMSNLNYHTMTPEDTETFIMQDEGIK